MESDSDVVLKFIQDFHSLIKESGVKMEIQQGNNCIRFDQDVRLDLGIPVQGSRNIRRKLYHLLERTLHG